MGSPTRLSAAIGSHTGSWTRDKHWGFEQRFWFASLVLCTLVCVCSGQSAGLNRSSHPQFYDFFRGNSQAYNPMVLVPPFATINVLFRCSFYFGARSRRRDLKHGIPHTSTFRALEERRYLNASLYRTWTETELIAFYHGSGSPPNPGPPKKPPTFCVDTEPVLNG